MPFNVPLPVNPNSVSEIQDNKCFFCYVSISVMRWVSFESLSVQPHLGMSRNGLSKNVRRLCRCMTIIAKDGFMTTVEVNTNTSTFKSSTCKSI